MEIRRKVSSPPTILVYAWLYRIGKRSSSGEPSLLCGERVPNLLPPLEFSWTGHLE